MNRKTVKFSLEPAKRGRKRSEGRRRLKSAGSPTNGSDHQPDAASKGNGLSKSEPESTPTQLHRTGKAALAAKPFVVDVDAATKTVTLNPELPIFGTTNKDATSALANQVLAIVPDTNGKLGVENLKYALNTIHGIGPRTNLKGYSPYR